MIKQIDKTCSRVFQAFKSFEGRSQHLRNILEYIEKDYFKQCGERFDKDEMINEFHNIQAAIRRLISLEYLEEIQKEVYELSEKGLEFNSFEEAQIERKEREQKEDILRDSLLASTNMQINNLSNILNDYQHLKQYRIGYYIGAFIVAVFTIFSFIVSLIALTKM